MSLTRPGCRLAFFDWQREIGSYGELGQRTCKCWRKIEDFLAKYIPEIAATLQYVPALRNIVCIQASTS